MGWTLNFNRSVRIEARRERITGDSGAVTGREVLRRAGVVRWIAGRLEDARDPRWIRHPLADLLRAALVLVAQGRRDHNDATAFGDDPALRLAVSGRSGTAPLSEGWGLASQPTLPRLVATLSEERGVQALREGLARFAGWWLRAMNGRLQKRLVIDVDSLPAKVHGEQPGREWNGHYHARIYHPLVASAGVTGDILDVRLRNGRVDTADGGPEFIVEILDRAEGTLCDEAIVRFDAGYPGGEALMSALEARGTHYVARVRSNAVLDRLALPATPGSARRWPVVCPATTRRGRGPANWTSRTGPGPGRAHAGSSRCWSNGPANCSRARSGC